MTTERKLINEMHWTIGRNLSLVNSALRRFADQPMDDLDRKRLESLKGAVTEASMWLRLIGVSEEPKETSTAPGFTKENIQRSIEDWDVGAMNRHINDKIRIMENHGR